MYIPTTFLSIVELDRVVLRPLYPLLFTLFIVPLAIKLRSDNIVKGIKRAGQEHKVSLYADDLLLYISDPLRSLPYALTIFENFGRISLYKLNRLKSELLTINPKAKETFISV